MIEWIKTIFKDRPDTSTPITAQWLNKLQDYMMQLGLIKDYVVDHGQNTNGSWRKWASGELVQRGRVTKQLTSSGILEITFPIPFIRPNAYFGGEMLYVNTTYITCTTALPTTTGVNLYYRDSRNGDPLTNIQGYTYEVVGEWK